MKENLDISAVVWDLDNTFWGWVHWAAEFYPKMADIIAEKTGKPLEEIQRGMQGFYTRAGTMECDWLVQDLEKKWYPEAVRMIQNQMVE